MTAPSGSPRDLTRALVDRQGALPSAVRQIVPRARAASDRALWLATGSALFVLSAWPLLLVDVPPLQDLPNHLASAYIAEHLDQYPDYAFNGFWKSNSLLALWLHLFGADHLFLAGRTFTAVALAVNAFGLPWFVLRVAGRRVMINASLCLWPLVHGFALAMGMLNFALSVPLSLTLVVLVGRQRAAPTLRRALAAAALSIAVWFVHPFPLIVVAALAAIEALAQRTWRARFGAACAMLLPLAPVATLMVATTLHHLIKAPGAPDATHGVAFLTPWELVPHFWLDASGALTCWGSATAIPAIVLLLLTRPGRCDSPIVGRRAVIALAIGFMGLPLMISNWWYLNTRMAPFLWAVLAVHLPRTLPRALVALLVASAIAFSASLGVDYLRLDRDRAELTAGIPAIPERATLLPLLFQHRKTSDFTASLTHAWGYYVLAKQTSAPLVFAVERSYELTYVNFPPPQLIPPLLDRFAELHATPAQVCGADPSGDASDPADCLARWQLLWSQFWRVAEPRFSHVLTWAMPTEAQLMIPAGYHLIFAAGDLSIYAQQHSPASAASP